MRNLLDLYFILEVSVRGVPLHKSVLAEQASFSYCESRMVGFHQPFTACTHFLNYIIYHPFFLPLSSSTGRCRSDSHLTLHWSHITVNSALPCLTIKHNTQQKKKNTYCNNCSLQVSKSLSISITLKCVVFAWCHLSQKIPDFFQFPFKAKACWDMCLSLWMIKRNSDLYPEPQIKEIYWPAGQTDLSICFHSLSNLCQIGIFLLFHGPFKLKNMLLSCFQGLILMPRRGDPSVDPRWVVFTHRHS